MKAKTKLLSVLLAVCMLFALMPTAAFAEETAGTQETTSAPVEQAALDTSEAEQSEAGTEQSEGKSGEETISETEQTTEQTEDGADAGQTDTIGIEESESGSESTVGIEDAKEVLSLGSEANGTDTLTGENSEEVTSAKGNEVRYLNDMDGNSADLPTAPTKNGDVWTVNPENAQYTLDGAYGSIDGKTINFGTGTYPEVLVLARPTKYEGSGTKYYNMTWSGTVWVKNDSSLSYEDFIKSPSDIVTYEREVKNVTFTADEGVVIPGFESSSGHVYGSGYDYVRDAQINGSTNSYYGVCSLRNITFSGLTIEDSISIANYVLNGDAVNTGIKILDCTFKGDTSKMESGGYAAINLKADSRSFDDIEVSGCKFTNYFQGIYSQGANGLQVRNNVFDGTKHNAIAVQTGASNKVAGDIIIEENIIKNAGDRAIRFGKASEANVITIQNNVMVDSGDREGQLIKGDTFPETGKVSLEHNYWAGKDVSTAVANESIRPENTGIIDGTFSEAVTQYVAEGYTAISYTVNGNTLYAVGNDAEAEVGNTKAGDTITVLKGDSITVPDQVKVKNSTGASITVNGTAVGVNQTIEAHNATKVEAKDATCTEGGNIAYWHCVDCGKYFSDEACATEISAPVTVKATGHTFGDWTVTKEATETEKGAKERTCSVCGYKETAEIPVVVVDIETQIVQNPLTDVPEELKATEFNTVEAITEELTRVAVTNAGYTAENTVVSDVKLQISTDGGVTWIDATEENFPEGGIPVTLDYPTGTGKDTHDFVVTHMFAVTSTKLKTTAGETETPAVTKTDKGIVVTLKGLSPVSVSWKEIEKAPAPTESPAASDAPTATSAPTPKAPPTGDSAAIGLWAALLAVCALGAAAALVYGRKRQSR